MTDNTQPQGEREAFEAWRKSLTTEQKYDFDSEGRGYRKDRSHMEFLAFQAGRASLRASPAVPVAQDEREASNRNGIAWAVSRWQAEVSQRPLVNVHRRTLDDTWRQVIRYFGGDPDKLIGPSHDDLKAKEQA